MANNFRNADAYFDADPVVPGRMFIRQGGFLRSGLEEFDAGFFGMPPREAAALDPQQRVLLEVTWEAFEDAGIPPGSTAGRGVGAYVGGFTFDAAGLAMADQNRHLLGVATLREQRRQQRGAFLRAEDGQYPATDHRPDRPPARQRPAVDIDSLTAVGLRVLLHKEFGVSVPAVKLQRNLTMAGLARLLSDELDRTPVDALQSLAVHEFTSADGLTVYGHLGLPPGPGPHPAVVVCTAGPGGALNADGDPVQVGEHPPLRAAGFAVLTVDHRGAPGHGPDFDARAEMGGRDIDDVLAAADHLAGLPEIDGARVSLLGTSRGAYTALTALGRAPDRWHRAVLLMGLYDPALLVTAEREQPGSFVPSRLGVGPDQLASHFAAPERRPLTSLGDVTAPMLIVHGEADPLIPVEHARDLAAEAGRLGRSARLVTVPGLAHDSRYDGEEWGSLWPRIAEFLAEG